MIDSGALLNIAELGLSGKKEDLLSFLEGLAAEAANKNKRVLYNGIRDLLEKYSGSNELEFSSSGGGTATSIQVGNLWIAESIAHQVRQFVVLNKKQNPHRAMSHTNKLLLYGPPGTGKTTLGIHIAQELGLPIHYVRIADIISSRFGETLKNISQLFEDKKREVIFIDEFDAFAKSRTDSQDVGELKRIVNSIIQTLDFHSAHKVVIVATNLIDSIDPALTRRFPFKIHVGYLRSEEAPLFFRFLTKNYEELEFKISDAEILSLIKIAQLKTIDSIKSLFDKVYLVASVNEIPEVGFHHFLDVLISDGYFSKSTLKEMRASDGATLKKIASELTRRGYSQERISKLFGIHRNSYAGYFK